MKKYYKVVRVRKHRKGASQLVSAIMGNGVGLALERAYSTMQWTEGVEGTPVIAFEGQANAERWANATMEIWEAQVKRPRKINRLAYFEGGKQRLTAFWKRIIGKRWTRLPYEGDCQLAPTGTVACEAIRLVRKIG